KPGDGYGLVNEGYGGIPVKEKGVYRFSVHARAVDGYAGGLVVRLVRISGEQLAEQRVDALTPEWKRHAVELTSSITDPDARLQVVMDTPGSVDLDVVSLFPKDTWNQRENGLRADLVRMLADMKPGFMRFPGGCIVEGNDLPNAYRWKDTVGPIWERKQNWNRWIQDDPKRPDHHYHQTYGLGFFEFFQLCEDIGAAPVPVLNCGMSCQFQAGQLVPADELDEWVQDAIDLVEFANGPVTSKWGKLRADMGHPEPFGMKHLGIGNEQWGEEYFKRYEVFYKALKRSNPEITLITTSGPGVDDGNWRFAWDKFRKGTPAEVVDEHYYRPPLWFLEHAARYDSYDRKGPKVFAGEFAAHRADRVSALDAAVCEAAFMTGLLRNADLVTMSCYAPLLAREGYVQWTPDLIWFDATRVMPTPSYHIQAMFGNNRPDRVVSSKLEDNDATSEPAGKAGLGTWDTQAEFKDLVIRRDRDVVFRSGDGIDGFTSNSGEWNGEGNLIRQTAAAEPAVVMVDQPVGGDCTISVKARKTGGSEGFLILFRSGDGS
ncbi:MAG: alpha-N-arabinofuranosidase, partial [Verrucomicrobiae bacterium]|nr:alpha-N-arabinofuranosidase [Verrucomicrobiae bacterium]